MRRWRRRSGGVRGAVVLFSPRAAARPGAGARAAAASRRGAVRPLRGHRPALHRRATSTLETEPGRLRAVRRRAAGAGAARRGRAPAAGRAGRAVARAGQLLRRAARLPALQPPRGAADGRAACRAVLLSGHHAEIARWRREQSLRLTARRRPDLIAAARAEDRQLAGRGVSSRSWRYNQGLFDPLPGIASLAALRCKTRRHDRQENPWT